MVGNMGRPKICAVCRHPKGTEVISEIALGRISTEDASKMLSIPRATIQKHIRECLKAEALGIEYIDTLKDLVDRLKHMVGDLEGAGTNIHTVKMTTSLVHELRGLITDLATLEGRLQMAPLIQINQLNIKLERITSFVLSNLCPICKEKLISHIEELGVKA